MKRCLPMCRTGSGSSPYQANGLHTARYPSSVTVRYPWHPLAGRELDVRGAWQSAYGLHFSCHLSDGTQCLIPEWMTDAVYCSGIKIVGNPFCCIDALRELRRFLDAGLFWHGPTSDITPEPQNGKGGKGERETDRCTATGITTARVNDTLAQPVGGRSKADHSSDQSIADKHGNPSKDAASSIVRGVV